MLLPSAASVLSLLIAAHAASSGLLHISGCSCLHASVVPRPSLLLQTASSSAGESQSHHVQVCVVALALLGREVAIPRAEEENAESVSQAGHAIAFEVVTSCLHVILIDEAL